MQLKKYIDRLMAREIIAQDGTGYYYYFLDGQQGSLDSACLRAIADALDELNH